MPIPEGPVNSLTCQMIKFQFSMLAVSVCLISQLGCDPPAQPEADPVGDVKQNEGAMPEPKTAEPKTPETTKAPVSGAVEGATHEDSSSAKSAKSDFSYSILHWNVESGGNDPATVAAQLVELGEYDLIGLSEVNVPEAYEEAINKKWPDRYQFVRGLTGANEDREDDHLWIGFDTETFELVDSQEMKEISGFVFDDGHHRVPLYVRLKDKSNGQEVVFLMNHFARGDKEFRQGQARTLREWARTQSIPIVAIGDYNLDYVFGTKKGNKAFDEMMQDNVWKWIRPVPMIDTNWSDYDGDGIDNYIDSLLDFSLLAGAAKTWKATSRVIVRENDFPDNDKTSDHRPVELILTDN